MLGSWTSLGAWGFAALALLLASGACYALGRLRARGRLEPEIRALRLELQRQSQLREAWAWRTDEQHRLLAWQPPAQAAGTGCVLFDDASSALSRALRAELPFSELRIDSATALDQSHRWALRGTPCHDELGRFSGFAGSARPLDETERSRLQASAVLPLLDGQAAPTWLAMPSPESGWRVTHCNAAALLALPGVAHSAPLDELLAQMPAPAAAAARTLAQADTPVAGVEGWRIESFAAAPGGPRGLLLMQRKSGSGEPAPGSEGDNFSFTVSHDLRAPIRVVEGFTRIVKEDYGRLLDRVGNDHLERVLGAAARMNLMIDAMLTLARLSSQPLAQQPVNLSQLAGFVVDELRRAAPERSADIEIEPGLSAQGDPTLLRLVLENLLGNAWKYSARSGRAQISLRAFSHGQPPGRAFVVRDNGAGFDMRSAERLFGLFQRLHSASDFPGHGVGLASVRRIVQRHGGAIWAEAEPGRGAAFYFTLAS